MKTMKIIKPFNFRSSFILIQRSLLSNFAKIFLIFNLLINSSILHALGISFATGTGCHRIFPLRLGVQQELDTYFRTDLAWPITGYFEGSVYSMRGKKSRWPNCNHRLNAIALAGVLRLERKDPIGILWPYFDFGIGLSLISKREMCGRDMGIRFQFEDRLGAGVRFGAERQFEMGYRLIHFSNGYLAQHNASINLHLIVLGYWF